MFPQMWSLLNFVRCCTFDSEAVIKMTIKGRSPTMRHASRTHRVALDWFFDRINLDPKIQIKYVDTKNQLADFLTKGNVTRDEWNHLRHVFKTSIFSSASCPEAMSKRMPQWTREERELWQNRSRRWTWSRRMRQALLQRRVRVRENVRGYSVHPVNKVRISQHYVQGNLPLVVQIKMTLRRVLKCGYQMQKRTTVRKNSLLQERSMIWVFKNVQGNLPQKIPISSSTTTWSGRTTTTHLVLTFHISRKSTRICDSNLIASQKTKWETSMWTRWYGECLWLSLSKPQFILETIVCHSTKNQPQ